ncbi:MAG: 30S ribosomal protein S12 methylthiotransferase RimO, partial [Terrimicrobiaceae bacterium]
MSTVTGEDRPPKVGMVSLGCAKNLVDAEIMLGDAAARGFEITADADEADVLVVNTCGFIESAKQESIDAILEARRKPGQKLVVSGCLAQRYREQLARELPEVDAFIGLDQVATAGEIFRAVLADERRAPNLLISLRSRYIPDYDTPRFRLTPSHTAYVKIAEGCNHPCSFCVIPQMRGRHRSRTIESVVAEVRNLVAEGVKEINLISQDTTYFGMDLWAEKAGPRQPVDSRRGPTLARLLDELATIEGEFWVRLLYTHPAHWSDELIAAIARNPKVARYVDMPLQHVHGDMLSAMRRETSREHIEDLISRLRAGIPGLAIRTTFIVGFPGETEEHFSS